MALSTVSAVTDQGLYPDVLENFRELIFGFCPASEPWEIADAAREISTTVGSSKFLEFVFAYENFKMEAVIGRSPKLIQAILIGIGYGLTKCYLSLWEAFRLEYDPLKKGRIQDDQHRRKPYLPLER